MQTIFRMNANEIDFNFFEAFQKLFKNKEVNITIEETNPAIDPKVIGKTMKETRKKYPPIIISGDTDIHAILKEINV